MFSYFEPNFIENSFGKVTFQIFIQNQIKMTWNNKIGYLAAILKRYNISFFPRIMFFDSEYIYGANFIAKFRWESGFLGGFMEPPPLGTPLPWAPTGVKVPFSLKC